MEYKRCTRCALCLADCVGYLNNIEHNLNPRAIFILLSEGKNKEVEDLTKKCRLLCEDGCKALEKCSLNLKMKNSKEELL